MRNKTTILKNCVSVLLAVLLGICPVTKDLYGEPGFEGKNFYFFSLPGLNNVWSSMSEKFSISYNPYQWDIQKEIQHFLKDQDHIAALTRNAKPYIYYIVQETIKRGLPAEIALIPMLESRYDPMSKSYCGAKGLWQFMPRTASGFGLTMNSWVDSRQNLLGSTEAALDYLAYLHDLFKDWLIAIAAYNSGQGKVRAAIRYNESHHLPVNFWALPLPTQTRDYVPRLLALASIIKNPDRYNVKLEHVPNKQFFKAIEVKNKKIDLKAVAKITKSDEKQIRNLNASLKRSITPPGSYKLLVPADKAEEVKQKLPALAEAHASDKGVSHHHSKDKKGSKHKASQKEKKIVLADENKTESESKTLKKNSEHKKSSHTKTGHKKSTLLAEADSNEKEHQKNTKKTGHKEHHHAHTKSGTEHRLADLNHKSKKKLG